LEEDDEKESLERCRPGWTCAGAVDALAALERAEAEPATITNWADERGYAFFWEFLADPPVFGDLGSDWSPEMARAWIRFRDLKKVGEVCEGRLRVAGMWIRRSRRLIGLDPLVAAETVDLVGARNLRDLREFLLVFKLIRHDVTFGHPTKQETDAPIVERRDRALLNDALRTGVIAASGISKNSLSRVNIPALEWIDLRSARSVLLDISSPEHWSKYARPDTYFSPQGLHYRRVRLSAEAVMARWRAVAKAVAPAALTARGEEQEVSPEEQLEKEFHAAAASNCGKVTDRRADEIRKNVNKQLCSNISRVAALRLRDRLDLKGKQGRKRNNP
jgi:hypothetical protein